MTRFLFDKDAAEVARERAIEQVECNAQLTWLDAAYAAVRSVSAEHETFTTDDVWKEMPADIREHAEPRAMGAVMRSAAKDGLCAATESWEASSRVACHRRPLRVWRSLQHGI